MGLSGKEVKGTAERVRRQWEKSADGWRRWEPYLTASSWSVTQTMIGVLRLRPGARVLDVGCGVGDPALAIAVQLGEQGTVLAIDPAEKMIEATRARAQRLALDNMRFRVGGPRAVSAADGPFDALAARWSVLFFEDVEAELAHLRGCLRPGGRIAVSAWMPRESNPMFAIPAQALGRVMELPRPGRDEPHVMRLSQDGELLGALSEAGFADVSERAVRMYQFAHDPEDYWDYLTGVSLSFRQAWEHLGPAEQAEVKDDVLEAVAAYEDGGMLQVPAVARVVWGVAPGPS